MHDSFVLDYQHKVLGQSIESADSYLLRKWLKSYICRKNRNKELKNLSIYIYIDIYIYIHLQGMTTGALSQSVSERFKRLVTLWMHPPMDASTVSGLGEMC